jgi:hypothetical protein
VSAVSLRTSAVIASGHRPLVRCRIFGTALRERNCVSGSPNSDLLLLLWAFPNKAVWVTLHDTHKYLLLCINDSKVVLCRDWLQPICFSVCAVSNAFIIEELVPRWSDP